MKRIAMVSSLLLSFAAVAYAAKPVMAPKPHAVVQHDHSPKPRIQAPVAHK